MVVYSQEDLGRAAQLTEEAVALMRELGDKGRLALGLCNLGWLAPLQDYLNRAADLYRERGVGGRGKRLIHFSEFANVGEVVLLIPLWYQRERNTVQRPASEGGEVGLDMR
jgi:hypothetical protein